MRCGIAAETIAYDVTAMEYPESVDTLDGLVLTGSKYSAYDTDEWILKLKRFVSTTFSTSNCPIIGICFGHQIIAEALGGKVVLNPVGWEVGWTPISLNARGKEIFKTQKSELVIMFNKVHTRNAQRSCY